MKFATSDGVHLYYEVDGDGPPLLMLSGIWSDTTTWNAQTRAFADDYCCIRLDHRGIGQSDKWVGTYSYDLHARDAKELLDHLGINCASILGVCHGGMAAVTLAIRHPTYVRALGLNATQLLKSARLTQSYLGWREILDKADFPTLYTAIIPAVMSEDWLAQNSTRLPALLETIEGRIEYDAAVRMTDALIDYASNGFTPKELATLTSPCLIMAGGQDMFIAAEAIERESTYLPHATYHLFPKSGHFPQRDGTEIYNAVVRDFLKAVHR